MRELQEERLDRMGIQKQDYSYADEMKNSKMNPIKYNKIKAVDPPIYSF